MPKEFRAVEHDATSPRSDDRFPLPMLPGFEIIDADPDALRPLPQHDDDMSAANPVLDNAAESSRAIFEAARMLNAAPAPSATLETRVSLIEQRLTAIEQRLLRAARIMA